MAHDGPVRRALCLALAAVTALALTGCDTGKDSSTASRCATPGGVHLGCRVDDVTTTTAHESTKLIIIVVPATATELRSRGSTRSSSTRDCVETVRPSRGRKTPTGRRPTTYSTRGPEPTRSQVHPSSCASARPYNRKVHEIGARGFYACGMRKFTRRDRPCVLCGAPSVEDRRVQRIEEPGPWHVYKVVPEIRCGNPDCRNYYERRDARAM